MELNGITAVVVGSSGRLGAATAKALAQSGCNCICHYNSNADAARNLVEEIEELGVRALAVRADLAESCGAEDLFKAATDFDTPQVLINAVGIFQAKALADVTFADAQNIFNLNLTASILTCREFAKMLHAKCPEAELPVGKIINISDIGGIRPWARYVLYCASKAGLIGATKALAKELAPGICVNSIAPGVIAWPEGFSESQKKRQLAFVPMARAGKIRELTEAAIFLLTNDYITGQVLSVDGGRCI